MKKWINNVRMMTRNDRVLVVTGERASGKTLFAKFLMKSLPRSTSMTTIYEHDFKDVFLLSKIYTAQVVVIDEVSDVAAVLEKLKQWLTSQQIAVDRMAKNQIRVLNTMNFLILTTGEYEPDPSERRVLVLDVSKALYELAEI